MKIFSLFFSLLVAPPILNAQNLDTTVKHVADKFQSTGVSAGFSIGVIYNGISSDYYFGSTIKGTGLPPNYSTIYEIGSVTKTFTSLLLCQAVIEHKVKLSDDIRKYLPEQYPNLQFKQKPIQLFQLANLTSALPNNLPEKMPAFKSMNVDSQLFEIRNFHDRYTKKQFLTSLHSVILTRSPGLSPQHSNTAAQLLGYILENIYKTSYQALLEKYITVPLKITNTCISLPANKARYYAHGYNDKSVLMPDIPRDAAAAGVLKSSLPDMMVYLKSEMSEQNEQVKLTHKPTWGDPGDMAIGLNWMIKINFDGQRKLWASGGTFGQSCYICFYPGRKFGIVILSNENDGGAEDRLSEMAQTVYNETYFTDKQRKAEGFSFSASVNQLLDSLKKNGFQTAIQSVKEIKKMDPVFKLYENEINSWGYYYFFKGEKQKALEIFKLNVSLYPLSSNTYDSLAETYEELGDKTKAIANYEYVLRLSPENKDVAGHLKKIKGPLASALDSYVTFKSS